MSEDLELRVEETATAHVVVARGALSLRTTAPLSAAVRKGLLDRGRVLVDVSGLRVEWRPSIQLFGTALAAAGGWPSARLVLVGPTAELARLLRDYGTTVEVPLAADPAEALRLLDRRPQRVRRTIELPTGRYAPQFARLLLTAACEDWHLEELRDRAQVVANELVTNAVEHAPGSATLSLALDDRGLTVGVEDRRPSPGLRERAGMGLRVVGGLSDSWGVSPHDDGKTVWALLRTGPVATP